MIKFYYRALDAVSGGRVYPLAGWQGSPPVPLWTVEWFFNLQDRRRRS